MLHGRHTFGGRSSREGIGNGQGSGDRLRKCRQRQGQGRSRQGIGDSKLEAEGQVETVEGKLQHAVSGNKDTIRDA